MAIMQFNLILVVSIKTENFEIKDEAWFLKNLFNLLMNIVIN